MAGNEGGTGAVPESVPDRLARTLERWLEAVERIPVTEDPAQIERVARLVGVLARSQTLITQARTAELRLGEARAKRRAARARAAALTAELQAQEAGEPGGLSGEALERELARLERDADAFLAECGACVPDAPEPVGSEERDGGDERVARPRSGEACGASGAEAA